MDNEAIGLSRVKKFYVCVTRPFEIFVSFVFRQKVAFTQFVDNLFHSFIIETSFAML